MGKLASQTPIRRHVALEFDDEKSVSEQTYIDTIGLVSKPNGDGGAIVYRRAGLGEDVPIADQEKAVGEVLTEMRKARKLSREQVGRFLNISDQTYSRYERRNHSMSVGTLLHICDLFDILPMEILSPAAPHLYGSTEEISRTNREIMMMIHKLSHSSREAIHKLLQERITLENEREELKQKQDAFALQFAQFKKTQEVFAKQYKELQKIGLVD